MDLFDHAMQKPCKKKRRWQLGCARRSLMICGQEIYRQRSLLRQAVGADKLISSIIRGGRPVQQDHASTTDREHRNHISIPCLRHGWEKRPREVIEAARERRRLYQQRTILFVAEVHAGTRLNRCLLPDRNRFDHPDRCNHQNPYFDVIPALVSRSPSSP